MPMFTPTPSKIWTPQAASGQTLIDLSSVPGWAREIIVGIKDLSYTAGSSFLCRIGTGSSPETSGYVGAVTGSSSYTFSDGFNFTADGAGATTLNGILILSLLDASTNTWGCNCTMGGLNAGSARSINGGGTKAISGTIGIVRITSPAGTDTFDGGTIYGLARP